MFFSDRSDSVVMDSLARGKSATSSSVLRFSRGVGHREGQACAIVAWVWGVPFVSQVIAYQEVRNDSRGRSGGKSQDA